MRPRGWIVTVGLCLTMAACGSDTAGDGGAGACSVGELCSCMNDFECPDPTVERCVAQLCVPRGADDAGGDVAADTGADSADDDTAQDMGQDIEPDESFDQGADVGQDAADAATDQTTEDGPGEDSSDTPPDSSDAADEEAGPAFDINSVHWMAVVQSAGGGVQSLWLTRSDDTGAFEVPGDDLQFSGLAWSRDGTALAGIVKKSDFSLTLRVWDFEAEASADHTIGLSRFSGAVWEDDNHILYDGDSGDDSDHPLYRLALDSGETNAISTPVTGQDDLSAQVADDGTIYFLRGSATFSAYALGSDTALGTGIVGRIALAPDDSVIAHTTTSGQIRTITLGSGSRSLRGPAGITSPAWFVDSRRLAVNTTTVPPVVRIIDTQDGSVIRTLAGVSGAVSSPAVSHAAAAAVDICTVFTTGVCAD